MNMILESLSNKVIKIDKDKDFESRLLKFYNFGDTNLVSRKKRTQLLTDYWSYISDLEDEAKNRLGRIKEERILENLKEVEDQINELLACNVFPIVSVSKRRLEEIKKLGGINSSKTWLPGLKVIAGTFAVKPYRPKKEIYDEDGDRILLEIKVAENKLVPRITGVGKKSCFQGVVCFREDFIPLDRIKVVKNYPI